MMMSASQPASYEPQKEPSNPFEKGPESPLKGNNHIGHYRGPYSVCTI